MKKMKKARMWFSLVGIILGLSVSSIAAGEKQRLNILLITVDTLRADYVGAYSQEHLQTPHIDQLASRGIVFTRAYAHNPLTLPSHVNILTGTTPLFHGISDNGGYRLEDRFLTMAEFLKDEKYATGAFVGAFPLDSRFGLDQGFEVYDDNYGTRNPLEFFYVERRAEKVVSSAMEWLQEQNTPWFCWIHVFDPHQPYLPPSPYDNKFSHDLYAGEVAYVDDQMGRVLRFLQEKDLMDSTIILFTSDHGEGLGDHGEETHGYFAYNSTIHIPLILFIPGQKAARHDTNVCHIDIFPTLCDILGLDIPEHIQGESLLSVTQANKRARPAIYFESLSPYLNRGWAPLKGFIRHQRKYIHLPIEELYDLENDFREQHNLAGDSELESPRYRLKKLEKELSNPHATQRSRDIDTETLAKLRTLGYVSSRTAPSKNRFTEKDDLKILLPIQNKMQAAVSFHMKGRSEKAAALLQEVTAENPHFALAYTNLATVYKETGRIPQAVEVLEKGLSHNPDNVAIMSKLGIMLTEAGRPREGVDILLKCTEREDFNPEYWNYLGVAYYKSGQFSEAVNSYQKALELDDDYALGHNNTGTLFLTAYLKSKDRKLFNLAVHHFKKAIQLDPSLASAYNGLGTAYMEEGHIDQAITLWEQSLEYRPDYSFPLYNLGKAYLIKGNKSRALEYLQTYKEKYYDRLPSREQKILQTLIQKCRNEK